MTNINYQDLLAAQRCFNDARDVGMDMLCDVMDEAEVKDKLYAMADSILTHASDIVAEQFPDADQELRYVAINVALLATGFGAIATAAGLTTEILDILEALAERQAEGMPDHLDFDDDDEATVN
jgi:hypothetical protein